MEASRARQMRTALQAQQPTVMCSGWRFHCVCPRHQREPLGPLAQYELHLRNNNERRAEARRKEVEELQRTLGKAAVHA